MFTHAELLTVEPSKVSTNGLMFTSSLQIAGVVSASTMVSRRRRASDWSTWSATLTRLPLLSRAGIRNVARFISAPAGAAAATRCGLLSSVKSPVVRLISGTAPRPSVRFRLGGTTSR